MSSKSRIPSQPKKVDTQIVVKEYIYDNLPISFIFQYFQTQSIRQGSFHNFCENRQAALSQVQDFFRTCKDLSTHTLGELERDQALRHQFHWNLICQTEPLKRINKALASAYKMPKATIEEFENEYIEFSMSNGQRVICVKRDNIIYPLFFDPNHLICQENGASRDSEKKQKWSYPSLLCADTSSDPIAKEEDEATRMIIGQIKQGTYKDINGILDDIKLFGL